MADCIFCLIASGAVAADVVYQDDQVIFFHDLAPKAPVHVLGVPRRHVASVAELKEEDDYLMGYLLRKCHEVAEKLDIAKDGFRLIVNIGRNGGQEVEHLHWHILGGKLLGPIICK